MTNRRLKQAKAKYVVGLTATPFRKDGHQPIIFMQRGPIRFNLSARKAAETSMFEHRVIPRFTDFNPPISDGESTIQARISSFEHLLVTS